jgi:hypothetical protein
MYRRTFFGEVESGVSMNTIARLSWDAATLLRRLGHRDDRYLSAAEGVDEHTDEGRPTRR